MEKSIRIITIAVVVAVGILAWRYFFPSPERVIKSNLADLAETVSFEGDEGNISRALSVDSVGGYFTQDVELEIDVRGYIGRQSINSRTEIRQGLLAAHANLKNLRIEFLDIHVELQPDGETAVANLTVDAFINGERAMLQEVNFTFKKVEGKWLISKIATVKTLSLLDWLPHGERLVSSFGSAA
ncbi:MAG TPA: hypothetical protein VEH04_07645 [Verrucomicrobiae bacterium]|nr:hypothetical protein [Verrucomicrobiae bacterium]